MYLGFKTNLEEFGVKFSDSDVEISKNREFMKT